MSIFYETRYVGIDIVVVLEVIQREGAYLIPVAPEFVQFVDVLAHGLILLDLRVVEVESGYLANEVGLHIGVVATAGYLIGAGGERELLLLIAETLHQYKQLLVEIHGFLPQAALRDTPAVFRHFYFTTPFAPIHQRNGESHFHKLIAFKARVCIAGAGVGAGIAYLGKEIDLAHVAFGFGYLVVGFELAAAHVAGELVVGERGRGHRCS